MLYKHLRDPNKITPNGGIISWSSLNEFIGWMEKQNDEINNIFIVILSSYFD